MQSCYDKTLLPVWWPSKVKQSLKDFLKKSVYLHTFKSNFRCCSSRTQDYQGNNFTVTKRKLFFFRSCKFFLKLEMVRIPFSPPKNGTDCMLHFSAFPERIWTLFSDHVATVGGWKIFRIILKNKQSWLLRKFEVSSRAFLSRFLDTQSRVKKR